jgi:hypothetical protein
MARPFRSGHQVRCSAEELRFSVSKCIGRPAGNSELLGEWFQYMTSHVVHHQRGLVLCLEDPTTLTIAKEVLKTSHFPESHSSHKLERTNIDIAPNFLN